MKFQHWSAILFVAFVGFWVNRIAISNSIAGPLEILIHQGLGATNLILLSLYVQALIKQ